mmetsp:Transcript_33425/g.105325  ORF Transcript_33425/g.105325 Transcript_33425/m.105325 type:complete len:84 (-) Transcript_33425:365-616(-)
MCSRWFLPLHATCCKLNEPLPLTLMEPPATRIVTQVQADQRLQIDDRYEIRKIVRVDGVEGEIQTLQSRAVLEGSYEGEKILA